MTLALISVASDPVLRSTLDDVAHSLGIEATYHIDHYVSGGDAIDYRGDAATLPVVFVSLDGDWEAAMETARILRSHPDSGFQVVLASRAMDMDMVRRILLDGEHTLLPLPATTGEIMTLLNRLDAKRRAGKPAEDGKVVLFAGVNGGAGTTTLATHAAVRLAEEGKRTLLIDGRRRLGYAGLYLGLTQSRGSVWDLAANRERLDDSLLASFVVPHSSGAHVLCSANKLAEHFNFSEESVKAVIEFLKARYEFVLIDASAGEETTPALVSTADLVLFVATAEIAPLRDLARWAEFYGRDDDRFQVVISRVGRGPITARHVEETSQIRVATTLPEMNGAISAAVNAGALVDVRVKDFHRAIDQILNLAAPRPLQEEESKGGWLKWVRK